MQSCNVLLVMMLFPISNKIKFIKSAHLILTIMGVFIISGADFTREKQINGTRM